MKPVMLPPGQLRLATNLLPIGSDTTANTIGMVRVCRWNDQLQPNWRRERNWISNRST